MTTTPEPRYTAECQECGQQHEAEYSHEGRFGEGPIYAVICTADERGLTDYYTSLLVTEAAPRAPYIDFTREG